MRSPEDTSMHFPALPNAASWSGLLLPKKQKPEQSALRKQLNWLLKMFGPINGVRRKIVAISTPATKSHSRSPKTHRLNSATKPEMD